MVTFVQQMNFSQMFDCTVSRVLCHPGGEMYFTQMFDCTVSRVLCQPGGEMYFTQMFDCTVSCVLCHPGGEMYSELDSSGSVTKLTTRVSLKGKFGETNLH